jgi:hypothetical protein
MLLCSGILSLSKYFMKTVEFWVVSEELQTMSNVLLFDRHGVGKRLQYNTEKDMWNIVALYERSLGPVAIDVCCRLFAVTIITSTLFYPLTK